VREKHVWSLRTQDELLFSYRNNNKPVTPVRSLTARWGSISSRVVKIPTIAELPTVTDMVDPRAVDHHSLHVAFERLQYAEELLAEACTLIMAPCGVPPRKQVEHGVS
jgi:hypothetical protein